MYNNVEFIQSVQDSYDNYKKFGKRSAKKVSPIHNYIANVLCGIFGEGYEIYCADRNKEFKVEGKYYNKNIDITVVRDNNPVFCLGVKFITSNFKQNANNYFESMLGETSNIQTNNNIPYAHIIVFRRETPYFDKLGNRIKTEVVTEKDLLKYINLVFDSNHFHKPFGIGICLVDENDDILVETDYKNNFSSIFGILTTTLSNERLFNTITELVQFLNFKRGNL